MITILKILAITSTMSFGMAPLPHKAMNIEYPKFLNAQLNDSIMQKALEYYDVPESNIVLKQAILESGHFNSYLCKKYNNPFGLYNSKTHTFYKFSHWVYAILYYKNNISNKYKRNESYYTFLDNMGYAEDPKYIEKIKTL